jgi:Spy/CpxP family protein refolding chaperone
MLKLKSLITTTVTPIALCLTLAIASPAMAHKGKHQKHDGMRQILSELSLTDTQKQDIKQLLKQTREDRDLFSTDAKSLKIQLRSLVQSSEWDQATVESVITQRQTLMQEKALDRATNKHQVWNLLSNDQKTEFVSQLEAHKAKRKEMDSKGKRKGNKQNRLNLTEEQLVAAKAIKDATKENSEEVKSKLKNYRQAEQSLIQSTAFGSEAWQTLNAEYQADFMAMAILKAKTKHEIWNLMTPEQQATALDKFEKGKRGKKGMNQYKTDIFI